MAGGCTGLYHSVVGPLLFGPDMLICLQQTWEKGVVLQHSFGECVP
jgi:hypothetical protein